MIPKETVDLILDTARIEEVIGDFVTLKRRGSSYVACCPFHNEKTPSFHVTPSKGIYKCFGCGKAGSAVGFVMEYEHMTYPEALRYLARKYNIEVKEEEESAEQIAARQRSESLMAVSEFAGKFFQEQLETEEGHHRLPVFPFPRPAAGDHPEVRAGLGTQVQIGLYPGRQGRRLQRRIPAGNRPLCPMGKRRHPARPLLRACHLPRPFRQRARDCLRRPDAPEGEE